MKILLLLLMIASCGKDSTNPSPTNKSAKESVSNLSVQVCEEDRLVCNSGCPSSFKEWESCANACWNGKENCVREKCENYCGEQSLGFNKFEECRNECIEKNKVIRY